MKQFYVTSLFFLCLFFTAYSCKKDDIKIDIEHPLNKDLELLFEYKPKDSLGLEKKLESTNKLYFKSKQLEVDIITYKTLLLKSTVYKQLKELDSAIYYADELYDLCLNNQDSIYLIRALNKLGSLYKYEEDYLKSFEKYNEAFKISELLKDNEKAGKALHSMSKIQTNIGDFVGSKATAIDGIEFLENTDNLRELAGLYHTVSVALKEEGKYRESLDFNSRTLRLAKNHSRRKEIGIGNILKFRNTKANILKEQQKFKEAISIYNKLLKDSIVINNEKEYARVLDNKGHALWLENNNNNASLDLMLKALELRNKNKNTVGLIASNIHLTEYYYHEDKLKAIHYAETAYENAKSVNAMDDILEALRLVFKLKEDLKKQILNNLSIEYVNTENKLTRLKNKTQEIYASTAFDINRERKKTQIQKLKKEKETNEKQFYQFISTLIIIISVFLFYLLKSMYKKKTLQAVYKTENHISKKVHDEVANDVFQVMTTLQSNSNVNESVIDDLDSIYIKTRNISKEHSVLDYEGDFKTTLNDLLLSYNINGVNVAIRDIGKVDWESISKLKKETIYKVLQELMVNMAKHSEAGVVVLNFKPERKKIHITYTDDGVGTTLKKGTGLQNMENRIQSINGTITFDSEISNGFKAKITV